MSRCGILPLSFLKVTWREAGILFNEAAEIVTVGNAYRFGGLTDGEVGFAYKVAGNRNLYLIYIIFGRNAHFIFKNVLKTAKA